MGASLCPQLLRKWWEHAQVSKVFDIIVASPLGGISWHWQHVLQKREKKAMGQSGSLPVDWVLPGAQPATHPHSCHSNGQLRNIPQGMLCRDTKMSETLGNCPPQGAAMPAGKQQ